MDVSYSQVSLNYYKFDILLLWTKSTFLQTALLPCADVSSLVNLENEKECVTCCIHALSSLASGGKEIYPFKPFSSDINWKTPHLQHAAI